MRLILTVFVLVVCSFVVKGQIINWDGSIEQISIGKNVHLLEDKASEYKASEIVEGLFDKRFLSSNKEIINFGFTESIYWVKFSLENTSKDSLLLELGQASLKIAELYYKTEDGNIHMTQSGYNISLHQKVHVDHFPVFSLPAGNNEIYLRILSNTSPFPIKIWKKHEYEVHSSRQKIMYGLYLGFMLFVIITNVFFFISLRKAIYLFYAFVVFIYSCYAAFVLDGFALYFFPKLDLMFWYLSIPTIGVTIQTAYCIVFLELKRFAPKLYKLGLIIVVYFAIYVFIRPFLAITTALTINTIHALVSFFVMGYFGFTVGKLGNKMGYYYSFAYMIYFLLVMIEAIYIQTGNPGYLFDLSHVALATLIEAFVLSFLLSKRTEWERRDSENEKLQAQRSLVESIQEHERFINEKNLELEKKVLERTESLKNVNKKLEVAIASKDKFFSIIAHDLKSPFSSLLGLSEILMEEFSDFSDSDKQKYIGLINGGLNNTYSLLENLLVWSQSQQGVLIFNRSDVKINDLLNETLSFVKQQLDSKNITFKNLIEGDVYLSVDRNMLLTIMRNLIVNAIKYTPRGGLIEVKVDKSNGTFENGYATIEVKDHGIGMNKHQQNYLFDITGNVSHKGTENESGTGLGLPICKEFVEKHNGKIWVKSNLGKGTSFFFTMPLGTEK